MKEFIYQAIDVRQIVHGSKPMDDWDEMSHIQIYKIDPALVIFLGAGYRESWKYRETQYLITHVPVDGHAIASND